MEITYDEYVKLTGDKVLGPGRPEHKFFDVPTTFAILDIDYDYGISEWRDSISFALLSGETLNSIADDIRESEGFIPLFRRNSEGQIDDEGWYNFFITLDRSGVIELYFNVENTDAEGGEYNIDLTEREQENIRDFLAIKALANMEAHVNRFLAGGDLYDGDGGEEM